MFVIQYRKYFYAFSLVIIALAIGAVGFFGITLGTDFTGGSLLEVSYPNGRPSLDVAKEKINTLSLEEYSIREAGNDSFIIKTKSISDLERQSILNILQVDGVAPQEVRFNSIGPVLGKELQGRAFVAIAVVIISIVLFIAFVFRHVSKPVSSFKYGFVAIVALLHDVIVPLGAFAALGHLYGFEVDTLFITAMLVILGYSINDTIIIFDRIRENLRAVKEEEREARFEVVVGQSLNETFGRSINTSLTVILCLIVLYVLGPEATKAFSLALLVGVTAGTYSSIFLAAPILVSLKKRQDLKKAI